MHRSARIAAGVHERGAQLGEAHLGGWRISLHGLPKLRAVETLAHTHQSAAQGDADRTA